MEDKQVKRIILSDYEVNRIEEVAIIISNLLDKFKTLEVVETENQNITWRNLSQLRETLYDIIEPQYLYIYNPNNKEEE